MANSQDNERRILLGQIVRGHGIRGEMIVKAFTADPADIAAYGALTDAAGNAPLKLSIVRVSDKGVVVRVQGVTDRNGADALRGRELYVARSRLPQAEPGSYYHTDLIGLDVLTADGARIGRVVDVQNFGAGDLLEIARDGTKETELIPFTNACVPDIDLARGRVTIVPPEMTGEPEPSADAEGEADDGTA